VIKPDLQPVVSLINELVPGDATIDQARSGLEALGERMDFAAGAVFSAETLGGVPVNRVTVPNTTRSRVIIHLHGGGFVMGSETTHRAIGSRLAQVAGATVILPGYRLAPEHPFPAAVEDVLSVYRAMLESGVSARAVTLSGDSAGGGLVVSAMIAIRDRGLPLPAAGVLYSPWGDLANVPPDDPREGTDDPIVTVAAMQPMAGAYLNGADPTEPLASPARADLTGLPPLMIHVAGPEYLRSDSVAIAATAGRDGVFVSLTIWPGMIHIFPAFAALLPADHEAAQAVAQTGAFIRTHSL
jgi:acetyl esterase/lipase